MDDAFSFGRWLKVRRVALRLTQAELAERIGYSTVTVRKLESDDLRPSRQIAEKLAAHLELVPEDRLDFIRFARGEATGEDLSLLGSFSGRQPGSKFIHHPSTHLPIPLTPLVGREEEVVAVERLLLHTNVRLVSLTGSGGSGKTRLGLEVAHVVREHFPDGLYFVDLTPIADPGLVAFTIASTIGLRETGGQPLLEMLKDFLREKRLLLLLDNFEQVISAAPLVAELLAACPRFNVLVTSREPLHVRGEKEYPVEPLALPEHLKDDGDPTDDISRLRITQYAAVELFVQRASDVKPNFAMTDENARVVAEICVRLDGLPLAIELAATRAKVLSPEAILARLIGTGNHAASSLRLLTGGARDLPVRQRTLRNTIAWSYDLLNDDEQKLFRRLSVFIGRCSLDAVAAVCSVDSDLNIAVLDGVTSLVDKNLLKQVEGKDSEPCFMMLEMIREYALERLIEAGEARLVQGRHVSFFLKLAEEAEPELRGREQIAWLNRLKAEHDNLRAAIRWAVEHDVEVALRLVGALIWFWLLHSHAQEGLRWASAALESPSGIATGAARAKAFLTAGVLAWVLRDTRASDWLEQSVGLWRTMGNQRGLGDALRHLGLVAVWQGEFALARRLEEESVALFRAVADKLGLALGLHCLGYLTMLEGDDRASRVLLEESIQLFRKAGDKYGLAIGLHTFGRLAARQGDPAGAQLLIKESIALWWDLGTKREIAFGLASLAEVAEQQGDYVEMVSLLQQSFLLFKEVGDKQWIAKMREGLERIAQLQG